MLIQSWERHLLHTNVLPHGAMAHITHISHILSSAANRVQQKSSTITSPRGQSIHTFWAEFPIYSLAKFETLCPPLCWNFIQVPIIQFTVKMPIFLAVTNCSEECRMVNMQIVAKSPSITVMHRSEICVHCSSNLAITALLQRGQGCGEILMITRGLG